METVREFDRPSNLVDSSATLLVHPGPIHPHRISAYAANSRIVDITVPIRRHLSEVVAEVLESQGWTSACGEFKQGRLSTFAYSFPIPGPDHTSRVALSPPQQVLEAKIVQGGITVGTRSGTPFAHVHAVLIDSSENRFGGHLYYETLVLEAGTSLRLWGTSDIEIESSFDPEIGVPIFQICGSNKLRHVAPKNDQNAVFARIRPNVDLTLAVEATLNRANFSGNIQMPGQIGSLIGAIFSDPGSLRYVKGPVVEVLKASPKIHKIGTKWRAEIEAEIVDSEGHLHSGVLARGLNPVAMTFELGLFRNPSNILN